ncbi:MAG: DUF397 domain-containing protein [Actinomycetota bacterium]|nr:DUF397 domain-containing protein [Actinomycetota bacterium]
MNWRKSSYSSSNGECVEVADLNDQTAVRDSKDPTGTALTFGNSQWSAFAVALRTGEFD